MTITNPYRPIMQGYWAIRGERREIARPPYIEILIIECKIIFGAHDLQRDISYFYYKLLYIN